MLRFRRRSTPLSAALVVGALTLTSPAASSVRRDTIPERLADSTFWRIVTTFSEPSGTFASENFVSNETEWQYVIPGVLARMKPGSAYLGVGPEQNFTYIAAFKPRIAFICDIRRQNMILHLMYKALIETSTDRADFLSKLWSRPRPDGLDSTTSPAALVAAYRAAVPDTLLRTINLSAIFGRLVREHRFVLSSEDSVTMRAVYGTFYAVGPDINYSSSSRRLGDGPNAGWTFSPSGTGSTWRIVTDSAGRTIVLRDSAGAVAAGTMVSVRGLSAQSYVSMANVWGATFASLMTEDDGTGVNRGWLGSESAFQTLKDFQLRNLLVPVVGNFGGPKALRAVGAYLKEHGVQVGAFYTSNVEQYLFQSNINRDFYENVATLPTDSSSLFIRSFPNTGRAFVTPGRRGSRLAQTTSSIDAIVRAHREGALLTYDDLARLQDR